MLFSSVKVWRNRPFFLSLTPQFEGISWKKANSKKLVTTANARCSELRMWSPDNSKWGEDFKGNEACHLINNLLLRRIPEKGTIWWRFHGPLCLALIRCSSFPARNSHWKATICRLMHNHAGAEMSQGKDRRQFLQANVRQDSFGKGTQTFDAALTFSWASSLNATF